MASRMAYMARPTVESILRFIFSMQESLAFSCGHENLPDLGSFRMPEALGPECAGQADFGPLKRIEHSPLVTTLPPLRIMTIGSCHTNTT